MNTCLVCDNKVSPRAKYCTPECRTIGMREIVARRRKQGIKKRLTKNGYYALYLPEHPMANSSGEVAEHRYVMSQHLGRLIEKTEEVHHVNHDTLDNRVENLMVLSKEQHFEIHRKERFKVKRAPWVIEKMKAGQLKWIESSQPKSCGSCGNVFKPTRPHQRFCSKVCRMGTRDRRGNIRHIKCLSCLKDFSTTDSRKTTCSTVCRSTYKNMLKLKPRAEGRKCKSCGMSLAPDRKVFCTGKCYRHYHNTVSRKAWRNK